MIEADEIRVSVLETEPSELAEIASAALGKNTVTVLDDVSADHITEPSLRRDTVALLRVQGTAEIDDAVEPWSVVLKVVEVPGNLSPGQDLSGEREAAAYESGFLNRHFSGVRPAKLYSVQRTEGLVWLWIEDLKQLVGPPWNLGHYTKAAEGIGEFGGSCVADLPYNHDWMGVDRIVKRWEHDEIRRVLGTTRNRVEGPLQIADYLSGKPARDYERMVNGLDALRPAVRNGQKSLTHGDLHARNLFVSDEKSGTNEVVAIDWSGIGPGPIESDIGTMVGGSLTWGSEEANLMIEGDRQIFESYMGGIKSSGLNRSETDARIGYVYAAGGYGVFFPSAIVMIEQRLYGHEYMLLRFGVDQDRVEAICNERLEFTADFVEEAVSLLP